MDPRMMQQSGRPGMPVRPGGARALMQRPPMPQIPNADTGQAMLQMGAENPQLAGAPGLAQAFTPTQQTTDELRMMQLEQGLPEAPQLAGATLDPYQQALMGYMERMKGAVPQIAQRR